MILSQHENVTKHILADKEALKVSASEKSIRGHEVVKRNQRPELSGAHFQVDLHVRGGLLNEKPLLRAREVVVKTDEYATALWSHPDEVNCIELVCINIALRNRGIQGALRRLTRLLGRRGVAQARERGTLTTPQEEPIKILGGYDPDSKATVG